MLKIKDTKTKNVLLLLAWAVYFAGYLARLNYGAVMAEIINEGVLGKSSAGLISTGAFVTYAIGQIVAGILGDKFRPNMVMLVGLIGTGICNFLMPFFTSASMLLIIWCINGFVQAMLWPPMLRIFAECYTKEDLPKMCVRVSTSSTAGTIAAYLITPLCILISGWKLIFVAAGVICIVLAIVWSYGISYVDKNRRLYGIEEEEEKSTGDDTVLSFRFIRQAGVYLMIVAILFHGILKDSITAWMPTFIMENYDLGSVSAILTTVILPVFSMLSLYVASFVNNHIFRNEAITSTFFYVLALIGTIIIRIFFSANLIVSLVSATLITSAMFGTNLMMITAVPANFVKYGKVSTLTGVLNAFTYLGSALSTYGVGAISEHFGWESTLTAWLICALIGTLFCALSIPKWTKFLHR